MRILKKLFGKKEEPIKSYSDFWNWFQRNEKGFFMAVKLNGNLEEDFFDKLSPKLEELRDGYFYVAGMCDDNTAELILTADGNAKNIAFVEELVNAAPQINGWKFTSLKPASNIEDVSIEMADNKFNGENISFYSNEVAEYPDEIDITIVHHDLTQENEGQITNGIYIFLDNYLGELDFVNNIDNLTIVGKQEAQKELIPISKLKDFLTWRQKEFVEKYDSTHYDTGNDTYSMFEAEFESGGKLFAVVNTELLNWDSKASHPWISVLTFRYNGRDNNGMPNNSDYKLLNKIEEDIMLELKNSDGYLNIGRQTAKEERKIYFACKDFRQPSKVFFKAQQIYSNSFKIEYDIYKDKYWQSFKRFTSN